MTRAARPDECVGVGARADAGHVSLEESFPGSRELGWQGSAAVVQGRALRSLRVGKVSGLSGSDALPTWQHLAHN